MKKIGSFIYTPFETVPVFEATGTLLDAHMSDGVLLALFDIPGVSNCYPVFFEQPEMIHYISTSCPAGTTLLLSGRNYTDNECPHLIASRCSTLSM